MTTAPPSRPNRLRNAASNVICPRPDTTNGSPISTVHQSDRRAEKGITSSAFMTEGALDVAMRETLGYPFFLQLFGRHLVEAMNAAGSGQADEAIAERAAKVFHLDQDDFYKGWRNELRLTGCGMLWEKAEGVEAGIPTLLDSVVRSAGPPADAACRAGFAIGREWAQWSAASAGAAQR